MVERKEGFDPHQTKTWKKIYQLRSDCHNQWEF
jgi:hypothetical protein